MSKNKRIYHKLAGFTIAELLVVIIIIGIIASLTAVAYTDITKKAIASSLQSDLSSSVDKLTGYQATYNSYPTALDSDNCPSAPTENTNFCLKASKNNSFTSYSSNGTSFTLIETNANGTSYTVTDEQAPFVTDANWVRIGGQVWAAHNLNVGVMISGTTEQTNNSVVEKYCIFNQESYCENYGGLYQLDEAMQYTTTEGTQGICPDGSHIPSDNDWKILEQELGMTKAQADSFGARGTDQGFQVEPGGTSGLNLPYAGERDTSGGVTTFGSNINMWSSNYADAYGYGPYSGGISRKLYGGAQIYRASDFKSYGFSVRCLKD